MKMTGRLKLIGISVLLVAGLGECDKPGSAEKAGEKMGRAVDDTGRKIGEVADKAGEKISEKAEKVGVAMDDVEITAKVKTAIYSEPGLKTLKISVDTVKGVVTLTGSVESQSSFDRAKTLAETVAGVKEVENQLQVKPTR